MANQQQELLQRNAPLIASNHGIIHSVQPLMPRTRSKDSIQLTNNLRDLYRHHAGALNVVQHGRIDSQRLLLENYKKLDSLSSHNVVQQHHSNHHGYLLNNPPQPINLKKAMYQAAAAVQGSHNGQRNLAINVNQQPSANPTSMLYR